MTRSLRTAWHCFFLTCKEIFSRIYNWAMASGFCDVSALRSAERGSFGEEGQLCWERVTSEPQLVLGSIPGLRTLCFPCRKTAAALGVGSGSK